MLRNAVTVGFGVAALVLGGCGSDNGISRACSAAAGAVFDECNQFSPTDQAIIGAALAGFGIDATPQQIEETSQGELAALCEDELGGAQISGSEADAFIDELDTTFGCQNVWDVIVEAINML